VAAHRVTIVGAGSIGQRHIRCFIATQRARVSFVEVNPQQRAAVATQFPDAVSCETLEDALEHPADVAVIATPASLHVPQATRFVERGAHVLIEKPLAVNLEGVDALRELVARKGVVAAVAYVMRAQPALAEMRGAVASGRFGKPLELVAVAGQDFAFYRPAYRSTYYARRSTGGGAVQDALTHILNAAQWCVGDVDRVIADAAHLKLEGVDVEDTVHVMARHGDVMASYALNQHQAPNETTLTVICERGTARFEMHTGRWRSSERAADGWAEHGPATPLDRDGPFIRQANAFLDAVEGKSSPLCSLDEGARTLRANLAILRSAESGWWVSTGETNSCALTI
jgi:predicted dehydrogenase